MSSPIGTMYIPCPQCGRLRTLRVPLNRWSISKVFNTRCPPCATPRAGRAAINAAEIAAEIAWIGTSPEQAARQLGTTPAAIARRFYRAGRPELARPFERATRAARRRRAA